MKSNKLKRVINNSRNYGGIDVFHRIVNAYHSHLYKEIGSFVGWYCGECDEYDEYVIFYKNNQYVCISYDHITYDTKISIIDEDIETYINKLKELDAKWNNI